MKNKLEIIRSSRRHATEFWVKGVERGTPVTTVTEHERSARK